MEAMDRVHVVHESRKAAGDEARHPAGSYSRAWVLDTVAFHDEFDELYGGIETAEGLTRMRWLATQTWRSTDDTTHHYIDLLRTNSADDWEVAYEEAHLADWYRVLMASHLRELPAVSTPKALKDRLPLVGWTPTEARRFVYGRELQSLVETFGSVPVIAQIAPLLTTGSRGWLSQDDVSAALTRLRSLDPRRFRDVQELVPMVEELYALLDAAAGHPDDVVLLIAD
jgi:hypothetical protein